MPDITVKAKGRYPDIVHARSIYISSITTGADLEMKVVFENGDTEIQSIVNGSKFVSPDSPIEKIIFINRSAAAIDVSYRYSSLLIYEENTLFGSVTVLGGDIIAETKNNSVDGLEYFAGAKLGAAAANYNGICLWNPATSGKVASLHSLSISSNTETYLLVENDISAYTVSTLHSNKKISNLRDGVIETYNITNPLPIIVVSGVAGVMFSAGASTLYAKKFASKEAPIEIQPGEGLCVATLLVNEGLNVDHEWLERSAV